MPAGSIDKICESTPLEKILSKKDIKLLKEKALDPDWLPSDSDSDDTIPEPAVDPMDISPDMKYICEELKNKGGIRFDNCQEFGLIWDLISKSEYPDNIKQQSQMILSQVLNFANMWIIHYTKHSG